jgi:hypothetical protein
MLSELLRCFKAFLSTPHAPRRIEEAQITIDPCYQSKIAGTKCRGQNVKMPKMNLDHPAYRIGGVQG